MKKILMIVVPSIVLAGAGYAYYYFIGCRIGGT